MKVKLKGGMRNEAVNAESLDYRELYINYLQGNESIALRNSSNDIVLFRPESPAPFKEVTGVSNDSGLITPPIWRDIILYQGVIPTIIFNCH